MEIELTNSLGGLKFGISIESLCEKLGQPDKIDRDAEELPLYIFNSIKSTFWFNDVGRLHWIQCNNPEATLWGNKIVGLELTKMLGIIETQFGYSPESEDYGSMESYSFERHQLELQAEYGEVTSVCFGHLWSAENEPIY